MLIESTTSVEASPVTTDSARTADVPHAGPTASLERAGAALRAVDELARRRRTRELVLALERLGAGLDATLITLDEATARPVRDASAPAVAAHDLPSWTPISTPVVPITAFVPAPVPPVAPSAPASVAPASVAPAPVPPAPVVPAPVVPEARPMRPAPAGLAAHVIDFSRTVPA